MVRMFRLPGVYWPQGDTHLLCEALARVPLGPATRVLDVCTGTGHVAVAAARRGVAQVTAVDISRRAVLSAAVNGLLWRQDLRVRRGDLFAPVAGERFDLVTVNPPYVPRVRGVPARHGRERSWDAGPDGRTAVDRICAEAPGVLAPGGVLLMVHSSLCGIERTLGLLEGAGLRASVDSRRSEPFGPVMRSRAAELRSVGLLPPAQDHEELVVVHARR